MNDPSNIDPLKLMQQEHGKLTPEPSRPAMPDKVRPAAPIVPQGSDPRPYEERLAALQNEQAEALRKGRIRPEEMQHKLDKLDREEREKILTAATRSEDARPSTPLQNQSLEKSNEPATKSKTELAKEYAEKEHALQTTRRNEQELKGPSVDQKSRQSESPIRQTVAERRKAVAAAEREREGGVREGFENARSELGLGGGGRGGGGRGR